MKRGELSSEMLDRQYIETKENFIFKRYKNTYESRNIYSIKIEKYILLFYEVSSQIL